MCLKSTAHTFRSEGGKFIWWNSDLFPESELGNRILDHYGGHEVELGTKTDGKRFSEIRLGARFLQTSGF